MKHLLLRLLLSATLAIGLVSTDAPAWAGAAAANAKPSGPGGGSSGQVLPASARPHGYSLEDLAKVTAAYNQYVTLPNLLPAQPVPNIPFQMLHKGTGNVFNVRQGTFLYIPIFWNDNSPDIIGNFPADVTNRAALLDYTYSDAEFGLDTTELVVDGKTVVLGPPYLVGVFAQLATQAFGGTQYMTVAAVVAPLTPGQHTVGFRFKATGAALGGTWQSSQTYTVNVD